MFFIQTFLGVKRYLELNHFSLLGLQTCQRIWCVTVHTLISQKNKVGTAKNELENGFAWGIASRTAQDYSVPLRAAEVFIATMATLINNLFLKSHVHFARRVVENRVRHREFSSSRWRQFLQRDRLQIEEERENRAALIFSSQNLREKIVTASVFLAIITAELIAPHHHHHHQGLTVFGKSSAVCGLRAFIIQRVDCVEKCWNLSHNCLFVCLTVSERISIGSRGSCVHRALLM